MAPVAQEVPLHTVDRTPEYEDFMTRLRDYHTKRGTTLDPEPKVGANSIDLFKVFNHIVASGGYDKVSEEKLAWRRMASELGIFSNNEASTAFALKEKFYKNLAAFEISTVHGKEPPPKDILEDVTAKGAGLLTRTRENFRPKRESTVGGGPDSATASGDDGTPVRERPTVDFGSSARASRGLREAPAQRVIFQPDTGSSRNSAAKAASNQAMHPTNQPPSAAAQAQMHVHGMPQMHHGSQPRGPSVVHHPQNVDNMSSQVSAYQPRQHKPLSLRAVATPGNSPNVFSKQSQQALQAQQAARQPIYPGTGTEGPNIYIRCLNALRSRIPAEQAYALNHLVKISYERGDKYRFDSFPGLAEGLVDKALEIGSLYYHVDWTVSWDLDASGDPFELDGNNGTHDILERIASLMEKDVPDVLQTEILADKLVLISEAVLTIRNMVTLPENAHNMSDYPPVKDLVCIILSLPVRDTLTELKNLALDIAEALTPWLVLGSDDPLYRVLLAQMDSNDRGTILTALRALGRISMNLDATNTLGDVPASLLQHISGWLLLNDDELMDACLDFLYQYTAVVPNLNNMLQSIPTEHLIDHLVRLLAHGARKVQQHQILVPEQRIPTVTNEIAVMPEGLLQEMLQLEEPDRVHRWVRCFFEEDSDSFVTQLAAWQAYQAAFVGPLKTLGQALITPADFIRNSTSVYKDSNAQVLRDPNDSQQKFIIHGIRARPSPLSLDGSTEYSRCMWATNSQNRTDRCGKLCLEAEEMWNHVLTAHVGAVKNESGQYDNAEKDFTCAWGDCTRYQQPTKLHLQDLARHISGHVTSTIAARRSSASGRRPSRSGVIPGRSMTLTYEETATMRDERNPALPPQAAGIPLSAVLVLRNIARNVVKTESEEHLIKMRERAKTEDERTGWNEKLFRPVMPRLFEVLAENKALSPYVASLLDLIRTGSEDVEPEE